MWDFRFGQAVGLMVKTAPYIAFRLVVYFGIALAYIVATGVGAGIGYGIGGFGDADFHGGATLLGGAVGFGLTAGVLYFLREYVLYVVKAGHIAVLVELLDGRELPDGQGQVGYGAAVVRQRFVQSSALFALDQLIKGVVNAVTGLIHAVASFLPVPGLQNLVGILKAFLRIAVGFVDEVILAHAIRAGAANPWESAREALVLYGQNYKVMLRNAAFLAVLLYFFAFIVFLFMLAPATALIYFLPGAWSSGGVLVALLFAWAFKAALLEPLAVTCMMQVFFKTTEGQAPDPAWEARLSELSGKFDQIKHKAIGKTRKSEAADHPALS